MIWGAALLAGILALDGLLVLRVRRGDIRRERDAQRAPAAIGGVVGARTPTGGRSSNPSSGPAAGLVVAAERESAVATWGRPDG